MKKVYASLMTVATVLAMTSCDSSVKESKLFGTAPGYYEEYQQKADELVKKMYAEEAPKRVLEIKREYNELGNEYAEKISKAAQEWSGHELDMTVGETLQAEGPIKINFTGDMASCLPYFNLSGDVKVRDGLTMDDFDANWLHETQVSLECRDSNDELIATYKVGNVTWKTWKGVTEDPHVKFTSFSFGKRDNLYAIDKMELVIYMTTDVEMGD